MVDDAREDISTTVDFMSGELEEVADDIGHLGRRFYKILRDDFVSRDGYLIVLLMVLLTIVLIPIDDDYRAGQVVSAIMLALLVLTILSRSHVSHTLRIVGGAVTGGAVLASLLVLIAGKTAEVGVARPNPEWVFALFAATYTLVLGLCFPAILKQAFQHRQISLNTVAAALAAYLLLGLIFASAYRFINVLNTPFFNQKPTNGFTYVYFSYITLTTVGYGDFTPANDAGRAVAILEALFGQVFLVTIVALVVSNLGVARDSLRARPAATTTAATASAAGVAGTAASSDPSGGPPGSLTP